MTEKQAKAEIADIRGQLNSLIKTMYNVADSVDKEFYGIGNEKCAQTIRKVAVNYESVLRVLNRINVPAAVAKANGGGGR